MHEGFIPHGEVLRTGVKATAQTDNTIHVRINLRPEPDGYWESCLATALPRARTAVAMSRRPRDQHPGTGYPTGLVFNIDSADELASMTAHIDEVIAEANQYYQTRYVDQHKQAIAAAEEQKRELAARQAELDRLTAELAPPAASTP